MKQFINILFAYGCEFFSAFVLFKLYGWYVQPHVLVAIPYVVFAGAMIILIEIRNAFVKVQTIRELAENPLEPKYLFAANLLRFSLSVFTLYIGYGVHRLFFL